ncbi:MAG: hypothetical protein COS82_02165 [Zetaproteobacteria bacterium CG06_land_8_20_14_3_00_59_53]|nr:MAG: hypothetical protein COX56_06125 [Zetaproteobacteria bacterium CG23_combo_of_CG06-09_8_20_14_all_59_86]PIQ63984.1 MAG: hypothetical protein COV97_11475 [Zetaproteobacteria bacterium CG11_big_fil_rev_8_21_14_0_20_59_439]PIU71202.1 MAG: hypothetical protein COS82_02165 [Zetaproteobacteria bacterium CG06_land_8_20_14_3_00_59_53]PIU96199.1 MAG: hypothetical protein COS62_09975 [Zetaproteobacteria bacterium CG03_land_8_20_14_0_80_59_51]PIY45424.1 MAG: hypothetical protein COZ02_09125 [Zetapr
MKYISGNSAGALLAKVLHIRYNHFPFACIAAALVCCAADIVRVVRHGCRSDSQEMEMKKSMIAAGLLIATALAVPAMACPGGGQCGGPGANQESRQQMMQQRMADELNLSDTQKAQFKKVHEDARPTMQAMRDAMRANRDAMQKLDPAASDYSAQVDKLAAEKGALVEGMMKERGRLQAEIAAILTPEQRAKHAELRKARQGKWKDRKDERRGDRPGRGDGPGNGPRGMGM